MNSVREGEMLGEVRMKGLTVLRSWEVKWFYDVLRKTLVCLVR